MPEPLVLLVHSPLLGPASWMPVARALGERGLSAVVPDLTPALRTAGGHVTRLAGRAAAAAGQGNVVLVAHSGAGPLLPAIAERITAGAVTGLVYVDAGLPHPGRSILDTLPDELATHLRGLAVRGELPPWTSWWPEELLREMVPDDHQRAALVRDCPPLPETLFTEPRPHVPDPTGSHAYLRLSAAYDEDMAEAERRGWLVVRLDAHHLLPLTDPGAVATHLAAMCA